MTPKHKQKIIISSEIDIPEDDLPPSDPISQSFSEEELDATSEGIPLATWTNAHQKIQTPSPSVRQGVFFTPDASYKRSLSHLGQHRSSSLPVSVKHPSIPIKPPIELSSEDIIFTPRIEGIHKNAQTQARRQETLARNQMARDEQQKLDAELARMDKIRLAGLEEQSKAMFFNELLVRLSTSALADLPGSGSTGI